MRVVTKTLLVHSPADCVPGRGEEVNIVWIVVFRKKRIVVGVLFADGTVDGFEALTSLRCSRLAKKIRQTSLKGIRITPQASGSQGSDAVSFQAATVSLCGNRTFSIAASAACGSKTMAALVHAPSPVLRDNT